MAKHEESDRSPEESYSFEKIVDAVGRGAVAAERFYRTHEGNKRLAGAVAGGKAGFALSRATGPKMLVTTPILCVAGAVTGAVVGPELIDKGMKPINEGTRRMWEWVTQRYRPRTLPKPEAPDPMDARYPHRLDL